MSFVATQRGKEHEWLRKHAEESGLGLDEELYSMGDELASNHEDERKRKQKVEKMRIQLKALLNIPLATNAGLLSGSRDGRSKVRKEKRRKVDLGLGISRPRKIGGGFVVVAK